MREVNGVYTQAFNRRHGRSGHLLQGRFKAPLVDKDNYLLELSRYVVLNPVRAGMVETAADWSWSSYQATIGKAVIPEQQRGHPSNRNAQQRGHPSNRREYRGQVFTFAYN